MNSRDYRDKLERSIKVANLPSDYDSKFITDLLTKVGKITDILKGQNEMIITYSSLLEKELSKMYNGLIIKENQNLRLEDATSFDVKLNEPSIYSPDISTRTTRIDGGSAREIRNQSKDFDIIKKDFNIPESFDEEKESLADLEQKELCNTNFKFSGS